MIRWIAGKCRGCGKTQIHAEGEPDSLCDNCATSAENVKLLQTALRDAREKLVLYRQAHSGEYIGGVEFNALIHQIDVALA